MGEVIHRSRMRIDLEPERIRRAVIEGFEDQPTVYGVRGGVAEHYGVEPSIEHPLTLDHIAMALGAWMTGTLGGALSARGIPSVPNKVSTEVEMEVERLEPKVIVISKIRLNYSVKVPKGKKSEAERSVGIHAQGCPVYRSLQRGIVVEWEADIQEE